MKSLAVAVALLVSVGALANIYTIRVSIEGFADGASEGGFYVAGGLPSLSLSSSTMDWGYPAFSCQEGTTCDATIDIPPTTGARGLEKFLAQSFDHSVQVLSVCLKA